MAALPEPLETSDSITSGSLAGPVGRGRMNWSYQVPQPAYQRHRQTEKSRSRRGKGGRDSCRLSTADCRRKGRNSKTNWLRTAGASGRPCRSRGAVPRDRCRPRHTAMRTCSLCVCLGVRAGWFPAAVRAGRSFCCREVRCPSGRGRIEGQPRRSQKCRALRSQGTNRELLSSVKDFPMGSCPRAKSPSTATAVPLPRFLAPCVEHRSAASCSPGSRVGLRLRRHRRRRGLQFVA